MELIAGLQNRNSASKLIDPGPGPDELEVMFQAALRAPDHAQLRPWKFVTIAGEERHRFGDLMAKATKIRQPDISADDLDKIRAKALRAPLIIAVAAVYQEHPKVPKQEQTLSAGCAAYGLLLAAEDLGYAGIWRTGSISFDPVVWRGLGLVADQEIIGFLYIGTRDGPSKPLPDHISSDFVASWDGQFD